MNKEYAVSWIKHIKGVLEICLSLMEQLKPESPHDSKLLTVYLHVMVIYLTAFSSVFNFLIFMSNFLEIFLGYLHTKTMATQISFTSTSTWKLVNSGKLPEALKNGMQQLCNNIMGHLVSLNYFPVLKVILLFNHSIE